MAYHITSQGFVGSQKIADTSTTQNHPLGTIVSGEDPTYGGGEFIYLKGVASTVVGSIVEYDTSFQSGLDTTALDTPRPLAVAMSANVANQYGWYQISGNAIAVKDSSVSFAAGAGFAASAGNAIAVASGLIINGGLVAVVASAKSTTLTVQVMVNRPHGPSDVS